MKTKKICVITGSRSEFWLLRGLIKEINLKKEFELQLIVTGSHLSPEFGMTINNIEDDNFLINKKIEIVMSSDSDIGISKSIGLGVISFSEALDELKPELILILGDRYEIFAASIASMVLQIPIAHIHGGELTLGAIDDGIRHSITKFSHIHFPATEKYRERIIQLGEDPKNVFNVGALGIDNIKNFNLWSKEKLEKNLGRNFLSNNLLITYHPETIDADNYYNFSQILESLELLKETRLIFTMPNADSNSRLIIQLIKDFTYKNKNSIYFENLGSIRYLSCLQYVDGVVGNSSSGIIEVPFFKIGTINIGDRQKGRMRCESIIDCNPNKKEISKAISKLYSREFQTKIKKQCNPYGNGETSKKIVEILSNLNFKKLIKKNFYDILSKN